jgi:hypothetical protein
VGRALSLGNGVAPVLVAAGGTAAYVVFRIPVGLADLIRRRPQTCLLNFASPLALQVRAVVVLAAERVGHVALIAVVPVPEGIVSAGGQRHKGEKSQSRGKSVLHHGDGDGDGDGGGGVPRSRWISERI